MKIVDLKLPEFAFLDGSNHEKPNVLHMRTLIYHVRSASVLEVFDYDDVSQNKDELSFKFINTSLYGDRERECMIIALHYSATLDKDIDKQQLIDEVLKPAAKWYCDYCNWEEMNIYRDECDDE